MKRRPPSSVRGMLVVSMIVTATIGSSVAVADAPLETSPERESVVGGQVDRIQLLFAQPVVVDESFVVVTDPSGAALPSAGALSVDETGRRVTAPIRRLTEPGVHRVDYRAVSESGAVTISSYEFTYEPGMAPPETVAAPEAAAGQGFWNRWTVLVVVIAVGAVIIVWRGRKAWRRW